jgi:hypothetical protein
LLLVKLYIETILTDFKKITRGKIKKASKTAGNEIQGCA